MTKLPAQYSQRSGTTHPMKGTLPSKVKVYTWDLIDPCVMKDCRAYSLCEFPKKVSMVKADGSPKKCRVMYWYMKGAAECLLQDIDQLGQVRAFQIGMHILPMYRSLCKIQIAEAGLADTLYENARGDIIVNQIHKHLLVINDGILKMWGRISRGIDERRSGHLPMLTPDFKIPEFLPGKRVKKK